MKKTIGIVLASLSLLLAGVAAIPANAEATSIVDAPTHEIFYTKANPDSSTLKLVNLRVNVTATKDNPTQDYEFIGTIQSADQDKAKLKQYKIIPAPNGLYFQKGSTATAAKYVATDGTRKGQYFYLLNMPELGSTLCWLINDNNGLVDGGGY